MPSAASRTVVVVGAEGRLGAAITAVGQQDPLLEVIPVTRAGWPAHTPAPALIIDASHPSALGNTVERCAEFGSALLYCVSNPSTPDITRLRELGARVPVCIAANLSPLHWIQAQVAALAAQRLGALDLASSLGLANSQTVIDRHPPTKRDAPSATARLLAGLLSHSAEIVVERDGEPVSDHRVEFAASAERLVITHAVRDLRLVAAGALLIGAELGGLGPGVFSCAELYESVVTVGAKR